MRPDAIDPAMARDAVLKVRSPDDLPEVDDETLANLIEHGIESVPPSQRAPLLRAIGNSPDLAAVVADLAPGAAAEQLASPFVTTFGLQQRTWRMAWAACAVLAASGTIWIASSPGSSEVQLLDGGVDGPAQDFADSLSQILRRSTVIILWVSLALLTLPAFLAGHRDARRKPALERRGSRP